MLSDFPKTRPPLPEEIKEIYASHYKQNREGNSLASSLSQKAESWLHKQAASDVRFDEASKTTLEIGAGTLNQLQYEPEVGPYDIVEPFKELYEGSASLGRIRHIYSDINEIPENPQYDRITSIAAFEHICNLPEVIARSGLLLRQNGALRASIPSEGTLLWTLGWKFTTGLEFKLRYGLDYGLLMKHEHVNSAKEIEDVLRYFYKDVKGRVFGLSRGFSLYQFYECTHPEIGKCQQYLVKMNTLMAIG